MNKVKVITFGEEEMGVGNEWDIFLSKYILDKNKVYENVKRNMKRIFSVLEICRIYYKVAFTL